MAIGVSDKDHNTIDQPLKKEKLFSRKPMDMAMAPFVEKKPVNQSLSRKKHVGVIEFAEKKQAECDKPERCNNVKRKRETGNDCEYSTTMDRARAIQASLGREFPSFVKCMLHSHVVASFCMGLPREFCRLHLAEDLTITLEDDGGKEYEAKYLLRKTMLSGGWRSYSIAHNLVPGDVLVFHLVTPSKFKIYTVRADCSDELDGALGLLKLDACAMQKDLNDEYALNYLIHAITQTEPENEVDQGITLSKPDTTFQTIYNFDITMNGTNINKKFPNHILTKYYDLCRSQQSHLHQNTVEGIFLDVAVGAITEMTNIADGIRASNAKTSRKELTTWDTTLRAFEVFGMDVSFLRSRIGQLMSLVDASKRCDEAKSERARARDELRNVVKSVKEMIGKLDGEIGDIEMETEKLASEFGDVASGAWG